ncbi:site-specific DNA-methyltransferase [Bosea sp. RAC05]|uniref:site-specific DNA-methyltransferase n=1 Tax=Bosea sp. RAC05 TaxID=1842539 RepID=UPI00083DC3F7|nr:site-specific DNA-methyltransferase [Bosea sp. RAC05]AOG02849.1 DNA methylase family protein [Bosea sp. RAC05]
MPTKLAVKSTPLSSLQKMVQLPLLQEIEAMGGRGKPGDIYERLAERLDIPKEATQAKREYAEGQTYDVFKAQVRWARQTAVMKGLIAGGKRGIWELADPGYKELEKARRGVTILIYSLDDGVALWGHAEDVASTIEKGSVSLILTSPPYPVINRAYGRFTVPEWLAWMSRLTAMWRELLTEDGTLAVNLMDVFSAGSPCLDPYVERFTLSALDDHGLHLAGRMPWHSTTKMPHIQWSVRQRVRPKNTVEHVLLFSKNPHPNWDIRRLPKQPYKERSQRQLDRDSARASELRPSGYNIKSGTFDRNDNGPIPSNLIISGGVSGNDAYSRRCREAGVPAHPARFPDEIPRRIILTTTEPGQVCYDPMAGSNTTGRVALDLGRKFISSDAMLAYVKSSAFRFDQRPDFQRHFEGA